MLTGLQGDNHWAAHLIRKCHSSSVTAVAWHPSGDMLAATSTDGRCMLFNARMQGEGALHDLPCCCSPCTYRQSVLSMYLSYAISPLWGIVNRIRLILHPEHAHCLNCLAVGTSQEVLEGPAEASALC